MGADNGDITAAVDAVNSKQLLIEIIQALEPPPASSATVEMITVEKDESVERKVEILESVGALLLLARVAVSLCGHEAHWGALIVISSRE